MICRRTTYFATFARLGIYETTSSKKVPTIRRTIQLSGMVQSACTRGLISVTVCEMSPIRQLLRGIILTMLSAIMCGQDALGEPCRVTIGLILPLTGNASSYGERALKGAEVAKASMRGRCEVSLVTSDSKFESAPGVAAYRSLVLSNLLDGVVTASSQVSIPIREMASRDRIIQLAIFTAANSYSKLNGTSFRISSRSRDEVVPLVELVSRASNPKVGALVLANDFGEAISSDFKTQLEEQGFRLSASERILPSSSDFRGEILRLKKAGITHLLMIGLPFQYVTLLRTAGEMQFNPQILSARNIEDPAVLRLGLPSGRVVYSYTFDEHSKDPYVASFVSLYRTMHGISPDAYAAEAYEAIHLLAQAAVLCGRDAACRIRVLRNQVFSSVFGQIRFDISGDTSYPLFMKTVDGSSFTRLVTTSPKTTE